MGDREGRVGEEEKERDINVHSDRVQQSGLPASTQWTCGVWSECDMGPCKAGPSGLRLHQQYADSCCSMVPHVSSFLCCSTVATELPTWRKSRLPRMSWAVLHLLIIHHGCLKGFSRAVFTSCNVCFTGGLGTSSPRPLSPAALPSIPCFLGKVVAFLDGEAQSGIRIKIFNFRV